MKGVNVCRPGIQDSNLQIGISVRRGIGGTCPARQAGRQLAQQGLLSALLDPLLPESTPEASQAHGLGQQALQPPNLSPVACAKQSKRAQVPAIWGAAREAVSLRTEGAEPIDSSRATAMDSAGLEADKDMPLAERVLPGNNDFQLGSVTAGTARTTAMYIAPSLGNVCADPDSEPSTSKLPQTLASTALGESRNSLAAVKSSGKEVPATAQQAVLHHGQKPSSSGTVSSEVGKSSFPQSKAACSAVSTQRSQDSADTIDSARGLAMKSGLAAIADHWLSKLHPSKSTDKQTSPAAAALSSKSSATLTSHGLSKATDGVISSPVGAVDGGASQQASQQSSHAPCFHLPLIAARLASFVDPGPSVVGGESHCDVKDPPEGLASGAVQKRARPLFSCSCAETHNAGREGSREHIDQTGLASQRTHLKKLLLDL